MKTATIPEALQNIPPEFWAKEWEPRDHCYRLTRRQDSPTISAEEWLDLRMKLGKVGYRFRDSGHCDTYGVISLDRELSARQVRLLRKRYVIERDCGADLGSAR